MAEYKFSKSIEIKGMWFLPANPGNRVAGILHYIPNKTLRLELIGSFGERTKVEDVLAKDVKDVIYGEGADGQKISLFCCYRSSSYNASCSFELTNYVCECCLVGIHANSMDNKGNYRLVGRNEELTHWCHPKILEQNMYVADGGKKKICIGFDHDNGNLISSVGIDGGITISLNGFVKYEAFAFHPQIEQYTELRISSNNKISFKSLLSNLYLYESFLSFALMRRVKFFEIIFYDDEIDKLLPNGEKNYKSIAFINPHNGHVAFKDEEVGTNHFLFSYDQVKRIYPDVLRKWYAESVDLSPIRHHLIKSVESKSFYDSTDFLIIIQAIEGFWWRFRNEEDKSHNKKNASLKVLIAELLTEFADIKKISSLDIDIKATVDSRHYYSHFLKRGEKPDKLDGKDLYILTQKLRMLLICCIMSFVGFSHEHINSLMSNSCCSQINL